MSNRILRLLNITKGSKKTDSLGLTGVVYKVPKPFDPKLMRVIPRVD